MAPGDSSEEQDVPTAPMENNPELPVTSSSGINQNSSLLRLSIEEEKAVKIMGHIVEAADSLCKPQSWFLGDEFCFRELPWFHSHHRRGLWMCISDMRAFLHRILPDGFFG
jgi:hypothetical protein